MTDDERLVRLAQRGDQRAFVELIERHRQAIYSLCYRMTGNAAYCVAKGGLRMLCRDLAQELAPHFCLPPVCRRGTIVLWWSWTQGE